MRHLRHQRQLKKKAAAAAAAAKKAAENDETKTNETNEPTEDAPPTTTSEPDEESDTGFPASFEDCSGTLELTVLRARDLHNSDSLGKQDPYCVVKGGGKEFKTKTHSGGGVNPSWDQSFSLSIDGTNSLHNNISIEIYDSDVGTDDFLGTVNVYVLELIQTNDGQYKWYAVERRVDGQVVESGELCLSVKWTAN